MTQKFNVGDKVRILSTEGEVKYNGERRYRVRRIDGNIGYGGDGTFELINAEPTQDKPTKKQRLSELERQVAELQAEVASLKEAQKPTYTMAVDFAKPTPLSANEQRKAIIAEAKAYLDDCKSDLSLNRGRGYVVPFKEGGGSGAGYICDLEFVVNAEKRTVVAILRWTNAWESEIKAKGIAKCAPDDVFNADIGKAIALGRALGLEVERFEQADKPTEKVVGQVVDVAFVGGDKSYLVGEVTRVNSQSELFFEKNGESDYCGEGVFFPNRVVNVPKGSRILNDTEAQY